MTIASCRIPPAAVSVTFAPIASRFDFVPIELHPQHVVAIAIVVAKKVRRTVVGGDHQVEIAVVVEVGVSCAARNHGAPQRRANVGRDILELSLALVTEEQRRLGVMKVGAHNADVVGDVAVRGKDIEMPVEIVVEEKAAEGERLRRWRSNSRAPPIDR